MSLNDQDAKSFIRDPDALETALEALTYRERVARSLTSVLEHSLVR